MKKCKECNKPITNKKLKYCNVICRNKHHYKKYKKYQQEWQRKKCGEYKKGKIQCLICGMWYNQLGSHVVQKHNMSARDYRINFGLDYKTGKSTCAKHLRDLYAEQALDNGTYKNLKKGAKFRFKKGSKTAGNYIRSEQTMNRLKNNVFKK